MTAAEEMKDKLGPSLCLAKWQQVSLHLPTGLNNSCYHPPLHEIDAQPLEFHPSALHNTAYKKEQRKKMLDGVRPKECNYCWTMEDAGHLSDRHYRSGEPWAAEHYDNIVDQPWDADVTPSYVEVNFSHGCNLACSYCSPQFSTEWGKDMDRWGAYPTKHPHNDPAHFKGRRLPIPVREVNPYVEAFWKWWPELYRDLNTFRITGGEPLLSKDTWSVLDYIISEKNPNRNLKLAINSNLGVPDALIDKLIEKIKKIEDEGRVKELILFTSCDTWGAQAEYIRTGLEFNRFWDNINKILLNCPKIVITFMVTYNALSVSNYDKLIQEIYKLKETYASPYRYWNSATFLDSSYLRWPSHQTVQILPYQFSEKIMNQAKLATFYSTPSFNSTQIGYSDVEVQKIKRIYDWMLAPQDSIQQLKNRHNFYKYFSEHDRRRGTNFVKTFPELEEFYNFCSTITI